MDCQGLRREHSLFRASGQPGEGGSSTHPPTHPPARPPTHQPARPPTHGAHECGDQHQQDVGRHQHDCKAGGKQRVGGCHPPAQRRLPRRHKVVEHDGPHKAAQTHCRQAQADRQQRVRARQGGEAVRSGQVECSWRGQKQGRRAAGPTASQHKQTTARQPACPPARLA